MIMETKKPKDMTPEEYKAHRKAIQQRAYQRYKDKYYENRTSCLVSKDAHTKLKEYCEHNNLNMFYHLSDIILANCS
jgi:sialic acid synthase SpsE